jgi:hypothetical protein
MPSRQLLSAMRVHLPELQVWNGWQSSFVVHDVLQPVSLHAKPPGQLPPATELHFPLPSHLPSHDAPQMTVVAG